MQARSEFCWYWAHVAGEGLQVKTGPGALHTIVLNQMSDADSVTLFDGIGAAGNVIGVIVTSFDEPVTLKYDIEFETGLYVLPSQGVDLTVTYI